MRLAPQSAAYDETRGGPIFLHSMWRTGSSYLLSRFERPGNMTFYEPFNGEIGSPRARAQARERYPEKHRELRHPSTTGGYFERYDAADPRTGRPIWSFATPRLTIFDVYNDMSKDGAALLDACLRLARASERTAVFGFCHSGTQIETLRSRFDGRHVYLTRAPREQFLSYAPHGNDFFCAATCVQLLSSRQLCAAACDLAPQLRPFANPAMRAIYRNAPHRMTMKFARGIRATLDLPTLYRLFYLSWLASNEAGKHGCDHLISLRALNDDEGARARFERDFDVRFEGLKVEECDPSVLAIPFAELEREVVAVWEARRPSVSFASATAKSAVG